MTNPIKTLTKKEWLLWVLSLTVVLISNLACPSPYPLTLAAALIMLRSSYYALGYAANDIALIVLRVLAALKDPSYLPVAVNFIIFFLNDIYGFVSWKKRELQQAL